MTVASMTGFARVQGGEAGYAWTWEVKSVNGRGLDIRCKLPIGYDSLDIPVREALAARVKRGTIGVNLTVNRPQTQPAYRINRELLDQLVGLLGDLHEAAPDAAPARLDGLLAMRGVIDTIEEQESEEERIEREAVILKSFRAAVGALSEMRRAEGTRLVGVLREQLDAIARSVDAAEASASLQPDAIRERLRGQVAALLDAVPALSEERLAQEAALLIAKSDVREELDRLRSHLDEARALIEGGGVIGRRLDFLCQEFNREANTLCSKSADVELTRIGLDLKTVIEQFREQVQNIE